MRAVASKRHDGSLAGMTFGSAVGSTEFLRSHGRRRDAHCTYPLRALSWPLHSRSTAHCSHALRFLLRFGFRLCEGVGVLLISPSYKQRLCVGLFPNNTHFPGSAIRSYLKLFEDGRLILGREFGFVRMIFERLSKFIRSSHALKAWL